MPMWVAPTEPRELRETLQLKGSAKVSLLPENYGVDVMWTAKGKLWGVQRKELHDLIASVYDGRLGREEHQMGNLHQAVIWIEGEMRYTTAGNLMLNNQQFRGREWTRNQIAGLEYSMMRQGIWLRYSKTCRELTTGILGLYMWTIKEKHSTLATRPPVKDVSYWGTASSRDFQIHLLTGLPGVGYELAQRMVEAGMLLSLRDEIGMKELMEVEGLGKKKAEGIMRAVREGS